MASMMDNLINERTNEAHDVVMCLLQDAGLDVPLKTAGELRVAIEHTLRGNSSDQALKLLGHETSAERTAREKAEVEAKQAKEV